MRLFHFYHFYFCCLLVLTTLASSLVDEEELEIQPLPDVHVVQHLQSSSPRPRSLRRSNSWPRRRHHNHHHDKHAHHMQRNHPNKTPEIRLDHTESSERRSPNWRGTGGIFRMDESKTASSSSSEEVSSSGGEHEYYSSYSSGTSSEESEGEERRRRNLGSTPKGRKLLRFMDKQEEKKRRRKMAKRIWRANMERRRLQREQEHQHFSHPKVGRKTAKWPPKK